MPNTTPTRPTPTRPTPTRPTPTRPTPPPTRYTFPVTSLIELSDDVELVSARRYGASLPVYTADYSPSCYLFFNKYGPARIIRAATFDAAFGAYLDESPPISEEEAKEVEEYLTADGDLPAGFYFQPNASGTGIVDLGCNWHFRCLNQYEANLYGIKLQICPII